MYLKGYVKGMGGVA